MPLNRQIDPVCTERLTLHINTTTHGKIQLNFITVTRYREKSQNNAAFRWLARSLR